MYLRLFLTFMKIGFIGFGGGFGMLPLIEKEMVDNGYLTKREFWDMVAISQTTPGPIAVNVATFVGYKIGGAFGAVVSTAGVVFPAFLIILLIAIGLRKYIETKEAQWILAGVKSAIIGLILLASYSLYSSIPAHKTSVILIALGTIISIFLGLNPFLVIIISGALGMVLGRLGLF